MPIAALTSPYDVHNDALSSVVMVSGTRMDALLRVRMTSPIVDSGAAYMHMQTRLPAMPLRHSQR